MSDSPPPIVWCLGGLDPNAAAGLLLDLRVIEAHGLDGRALTTLLTAQTDEAWLGGWPTPATALRAQAEALTKQGAPHAIKLGALGSEEGMHLAAELLRRHPGVPSVLDPVSRSSSGGTLGPPLARLRTHLFPHTFILTPNVPEAEILLDRRIDSRAAQIEAARALRDLGPRHVLLKGGHLPEGRPHDVWLDDRGKLRTFEHAPLPFSVRGTGCALASALAARLARGEAPETAIPAALAWLQRAMQRAGAGGATAVRRLLVPRPPERTERP